ncbi:MAG: hypothetical protein ACE149_15535 [Armatimonadota bacterium]
MPEVVIAADPGRGKCGIAVVLRNGEVAHRAVVPAAELAERIAELLGLYPSATVVLGNRTGAREAEAAIQARCGVRPVFVDESGSTLEGRRRYFRDNPRRGWRRLVPIGLQTPPRPYDDFVAVVLAERYLKALDRG